MNSPPETPGTRPAPRPLLIWFTQTLALLLAAVFLAFVVSAIVALPRLRADGVVPASFVNLIVVHVLLIFLLVVLSVGLARRRIWAWPGSIVFSLALLVFVLSPYVWPTAGAMAVLGTKPDSMIRSFPGEITIFLALTFYPLRLFFSRRVRAFFGLAAAPAKREDPDRQRH